LAAVDRDVCLELAELARLRLGDDEVDALARQLARIVGYLEQLQQVDVQGVPEHSSTLSTAPLRADRAGLSLERARVLAGVPDAQDGQVRVPRFVEE
jgi:aspartyl-tRNA(Asn)/glutamyl-tRNA(Gln) amidotransferase subunit C